MPTGYTAPIVTGEVTTLRQYALICARAFGATIAQRDEPLTNPPRLEAPRSYHDEQLERIRDELTHLTTMTADEHQTAADVAYIDALRRAGERVAENRRTADRYAAMRAQVEQWTPPTGEHVELKQFMLSQLDDATKFDVLTDEQLTRWHSEPVRQTGAEWFDAEFDRLTAQHAYHLKARADDHRRTAERNDWIAQLYAALPPATEEPTNG
jgi:hypothetical protein